MSKSLALVILGSMLLALTASAQQTHHLTLKQALALGLRQNSEILIARLAEQKAEQQIRIQQDPFFPKLYAGSGAAWSNGYPQTIDGNAPSIVQARTAMTIYNQPANYRVAEAKQGHRTAALEAGATQDDIAFRIATQFLDAAHLMQNLDILKRQAADLERIRDTIRARLADGRALPLEEKKANLDLAVSRDRILELELNIDNAESDLAYLLGLPPTDRVRPQLDNFHIPDPPDEASVLREALQADKALRVLESQIQAKRLEIKSYRAERLPQIDLVAQYALLAHYNYADSFARFQPNNGELGISIKLPLLVGPAGKAWATTGELEIQKLQLQLRQKQATVQTTLHKHYQDLERANSAKAVAKSALDWAQENFRVILELHDAGRAPLKDLDEARVLENDKWLAYHTKSNLVDQARLAILKQAGTMIASLQ